MIICKESELIYSVYAPSYLCIIINKMGVVGKDSKFGLFDETVSFKISSSVLNKIRSKSNKF